MNYQKHYTALIERAKIRQLPEDLYVEKHHIQPRCMDGSDDDSNLVKLTAEEHYVAHQLLIKMYPCNPKLIYAVRMMTVNNPNQKRFTNKEYGWIRRKVNKQISKSLKGNTRSLGYKHTEEAKRKIGAAHKGMKRSQQTKDKMSMAQKGRKLSQSHIENIRKSRLGKTLTKESKEKISKTLTGHPVSKETRQKLSDRRLNMAPEEKAKLSAKLSAWQKALPPVVCPYCKKEGRGTAMKRWHFNNCRHKN